MGRARERKRGKRADKIQARKNKQIHLVRPRQVGRCVQEPQRGLLVLQRRRIRAGCKCASLSLSSLFLSFSCMHTRTPRKSRPRRCVGVNETRPPLAIVPPQARQRPSERKREKRQRWLAAVFRSVSIRLHPAAQATATLRRFVNLDELGLSGLIHAHLIRSES